MITKKVIKGQEVLCFSVGQAAARLHRNPATLRRLERDGVIPAPKYRSENGYRLYTAHELTALEEAFKKFKCEQGKPFPKEFTDFITQAFTAIAAKY